MCGRQMAGLEVCGSTPNRAGSFQESLPRPAQHTAIRCGRPASRKHVSSRAVAPCKCRREPVGRAPGLKKASVRVQGLRARVCVDASIFAGAAIIWAFFITTRELFCDLSRHVCTCDLREICDAGRATLSGGGGKSAQQAGSHVAPGNRRLRPRRAKREKNTNPETTGHGPPGGVPNVGKCCRPLSFCPSARSIPRSR